MLVVCDDEDVVNLVSHEMSWIVDSGASTHATSRKKFFTSHTPSIYELVKMGNNSFPTVIGIKNVCLETIKNTRLVLGNTKHDVDSQV